MLGSVPGPADTELAVALIEGSVMTKVASFVRMVLPAYVATSKVTVFVPLAKLATVSGPGCKNRPKSELGLGKWCVP